MSQDWVPETIPAFGLAFERPGWWEHREEVEDGRTTFVTWDVYTGTLRISPWRVERGRFHAADYLAQVQASEPGARLEQLGGRDWVVFEKAGSDATRLHFYVTGHQDLIVACSFSYLVELLDDSYAKDEVEGALDDAVRVLTSLTIA